MDKGKVIKMDNPADFSFCKESFEKFGERRLFSQGEYFARLGAEMEYACKIFSETVSNTPSRLLTGTTGSFIVLIYQTIL